jgi:hypothetical protein
LKSRQISKPEDKDAKENQYPTEMMREFGLHGAFEDGFSELLEKAVFSENIIGRLVVF